MSLCFLVMDFTNSRSERSGLTITTDSLKAWIETQLVLIFSPSHFFSKRSSFKILWSSQCRGSNARFPPLSSISLGWFWFRFFCSHKAVQHSHILSSRLIWAFFDRSFVANLQDLVIIHVIKILSSFFDT